MCLHAKEKLSIRTSAASVFLVVSKVGVYCIISIEVFGNILTTARRESRAKYNEQRLGMGLIWLSVFPPAPVFISYYSLYVFRLFLLLRGVMVHYQLRPSRQGSRYTASFNNCFFSDAVAPSSAFFYPRPQAESIVVNVKMRGN